MTIPMDCQTPTNPKEVNNMAKTKPAPVTMHPSELAAALEVDAKTLRTWLRANFTRPAEEKNTSWMLTEDMILAAQDHFASDEDTDESDES